MYASTHQDGQSREDSRPDSRRQVGSVHEVARGGDNLPEGQRQQLQDAEPHVRDHS